MKIKIPKYLTADAGLIAARHRKWNIAPLTPFVFGFSLAVMSQSVLAINTPVLADIWLDPNVVTGSVNRGVLGNNLEVSSYDPAYFSETQSNRGGGIWDPVTNKPVQGFTDLAKNAGMSSLRWPGGDISRYLHWKNMIGPVAKRPKQKFGLPEYLTFCANIGASPMITIASTVGTEDDAADLIEYLNAPADGSNPNGGVDWAALRSADGHKEPWNVIWFEYGNEEFNTPRTVGDYIAKYPKYQLKMKAVDPKIKLGAVFEDSTNVNSGWTYKVLTQIGQQIDFAIVHPYLPKLNSEAALKFSQTQVQLAAVSADADLTYRLGLYNSAIKQYTGRTNVPLAATEYNSNFVQDLPIPYRQTIFNALHTADYVRVFLKPESNVTYANFWQYANGYWGMITGFSHLNQPLVKQANYYVFELYNKYLGSQLIKMDTETSTIEFSGGLSISSRASLPSMANTATALPLTPTWTLRSFPEGSQKVVSNVVTVDFNKTKDADYYHAQKEFAVEPNSLYRVTVNVRTINIQGGKIGIAVEDTRGWTKMYDQPSNLFLSGTSAWTPVTVEYRTPSDAKKMRFMARRYKGQGIISGRAEFGTFKVEKVAQNFGALASVVGTASKSADDNELFLILINKNLGTSVDAAIKIPTNYRPLIGESITGTSPNATNIKAGQPNNVTLAPLTVQENTLGNISVQLPASSVSGIKFVRQ